MSSKSEKTSTTKKDPPSSGLKSFLSGGFGGVCLVFAGHPLDLIKVRLQTQTGNEYKGALDCAKKIVARDGAIGLYRGMATPLIGVTPIFAVCFWGYDVGQRIARVLGGMEKNEKLGMTGIMFAGGFSAIPTTAIMTPIERVKVIMQIQGTETEKGIKPKYSGPLDVARQLVKQGGIQSLYKGTAATLLRDIPGSVAYFAAYEGFKKFLTPKGSKPEDLKPIPILIAGGMAGVCNWLVAIPPDVLKSRLQAAPEGTYTGLRDVLTQLLQKEGPAALFKGVGPAMLRAFPANAACFLGVEVSMKVMNRLW